MLKKALFMSLICLCAVSFGKEKKNIDYFKVKGEYKTYFDDKNVKQHKDSKVEGSLADGKIYKFRFILDKQDNDKEIYPWASVDIRSDETENLSQVESIEITYKSDYRVKLVLPMLNVKKDGKDVDLVGGGATHFAYLSKAADEWKTVVIPAKDFKQPSWVEDDEEVKKKLYVPFNASYVEAVEIGFEASESKERDVTFELKELVANGVSSSIFHSQALKSTTGFTQVTTNSISLNITENDNYNLALYSAQGKLVKNIFSNKNLEKKAHSFSWNYGNIAKGMYYLRLSTAHKNIMQKINLK